MVGLAISVATALWLTPARAQSPQDFLNQGMEAFQKQDWTKARTAFRAALQLDEGNPVLLHNLALTEFRAGRQGLALGLWRKALATSPSYSPSRTAIAWAQKKLERSEIAHEKELWEGLRTFVLQPLSLDRYLLATMLLMLMSGWTLLRYFGARRRALQDENPLPPLPWIASTISTFFVVSVTLSVAKIIDHQTIRGTIIEPKITAKSTPDEAGTPLFELYEGLEVILRNHSAEWVQVTYPGGPTGWVKRTSLFATTDQVKP